MRKNSTVCRTSSSFRYVFRVKEVHYRGRELYLMSFLLHQQRNLNNAFAYDLVPSPSVIVAALKAARRVNDFPTAVRVFEGQTEPRPDR